MEVREAVTELLLAAVERGRLSLERYEALLTDVLTATTEAELAELVRVHAPPVALTPPERRINEVVEIVTTGMFADIKRAGRWQVPKRMKVRTGASRIVLDPTEAEFDGWEIDIDASADLGDIVLVVPRGMTVQPVRITGPLRDELDPPVPGYPLVRLTASVTTLGKIRLRHPKPTRSRSRR